MTLLRNTLFIIKKQKQLSWLTNSYAQIAIIFPFVVAVPRYLSQNISLGGLMQIANCFGKVQDAMSYFVDVYASLAEWQSCAERLLSFDRHIAAIEKETEENQAALSAKRLLTSSASRMSPFPYLPWMKTKGHGKSFHLRAVQSSRENMSS